MINIDYSEHGVDAVMGCIETIRATGGDEFIEYCGDGSLEMFGEDDHGRETSGDVSVYSIINAAGDAIADLQAQLAAERERVAKLAEHNKYVQQELYAHQSVLGQVLRGREYVPTEQESSVLNVETIRQSIAQRDARVAAEGCAKGLRQAALICDSYASEHDNPDRAFGARAVSRVMKAQAAKSDEIASGDFHED